MQKFINSMMAIFAIAAFGLVACNADDKFVSEGAVSVRSAQQVVDTVEVSGVISGNTTWSCDTVYQLDGKVYVSNGATLTIEAGTRIEGLYNANPDSASALVITRGSKIDAQGDCDKPIVFTAANGEKGGWGGLVLLGKAVNNEGLNVPIEGISSGTVPPGVDVYHGGTDNFDNSGILRYVRVEFAGATIAEDNELNSFTFGSVGCGTTLEHLQAYYGADDGFEWFGGCVNAKCLISTAADDDAFDFDLGYTGKLQFLLAVLDPCASYSANANGIECDNNAGGSDATPFTRPVISNLTIVGTSTGTAAGGNVLYGAHFRRATRFVLRNSVVYGYNKVIYLQGATVTNWVGTEPYVCGNDSSYLADNVIGLINISTVAYDPNTTFTTNSNSVNYTAIALDDPFAYNRFFDADYAPLTPAEDPAASGANFVGLNCDYDCGFSFTNVTYKGAIPPTGEDVSCCGVNGYWIAADWVNKDFPIYCK
jgi:hypothetical protein